MQQFLDQTMTTIEPQRFYFALWLFTPSIVVVSFNLRKHKNPVSLSLPSSVGIASPMVFAVEFHHRLVFEQ